MGAAFLGIVLGLAKDGRKKWAPVGGGTVRGVVGGDGEAVALRLFCWGFILSFWAWYSRFLGLSRWGCWIVCLGLGLQTFQGLVYFLCFTYERV